MKYVILFGILCVPVATFAVTFTKNSTVTGNASIAGSISKGSGTFVIDHPLDPKNSLLYHSFLESPEVKNIYDGIATLDENGEANITLPQYFIALNKDFRYFASPIGAPMPQLHLKEGVHRSMISGHIQFVLSGGVAGKRVSWQVTGIRRDPFILSHPIEVEVDKGPRALMRRGECIFAPLCE